MNKIKFGKMALTGATALLGVASFVVGILTKNNEVNEAAEKAAEIVMKNLSK